MYGLFRAGELGWGGVWAKPFLDHISRENWVGRVGNRGTHAHLKGCSELAGWRRDTEMVIWIFCLFLIFLSFSDFLHLHLHLPRDWGLGLDMVGFGFGFGVWIHTGF